MESTELLLVKIFFSGKYSTSQDNTDYSVFEFALYLLKVARENPHLRRILHEIVIKFLTWWIDQRYYNKEKKFPPVGGLFMGDDGVVWNKVKALSGIVTLSGYKKFVKDCFHMEIKPSACGEYNTLYSKLDEFGNYVLKDWYFEGKMYRIPTGPVFLKRRFIEHIFPSGNKRCVPVRETKEYYGRVGRSISQIENGLIELSRIHGLMFDTMGTNKQAYAFLSFCRQRIIEEMRGINITDKGYLDYLKMEGQGSQINMEYKFIIEKMQKLGFGEFVPDLTSLPKWEKLSSLLDRDYSPIWGSREFVHPGIWYNTQNTVEM